MVEKGRSGKRPARPVRKEGEEEVNMTSGGVPGLPGKEKDSMFICVFVCFLMFFDCNAIISF